MSSAELQVRPLTDAQMDTFLDNDNLAFLEAPAGPEARAWQRRWLETDRTIGLFEGAEQVGGASIFTLRLTVPEGRQVPVAGVTWVSVLPTHQRRGGMRAMMRYQLDGIHEAGVEPVAVLTASDPAIYGRFGFGEATRFVEVNIPRHANTLRLPEGTGDVRVRFLDLAAKLHVIRELYARQLPRRAGMVGKPDWYLEFIAADADFVRNGRSAQRVILAEREGTPVGYARYRAAGTRIDVEEVYADDPAAHAALWRLLLNIDLATTTHMSEMPIDDPLFSMLENPRAANPVVKDGLYVRLVDLDRALTARTYTTPIDVVLDVTDGFCPWNAGRWRLTGDENGATCVRSDSRADVSLDVRELGAAYLGGTSLRTLERAGRVTEHTKGAVYAAAVAFGSDLQPFLPVHI